MRRRSSGLDSAKTIKVAEATTSNRLVRSLAVVGVKVVGDIENITEEQFKHIPGVGIKTRKEMGVLMRRFCVQFSDKPIAPVKSIQGELVRPDWDHYFMGIAHAVSARAIDPSIQVGAVIVNTGKRIQATGYNGFPPGFPDAALPRTRPEKYPYTVHAEVNAIASSQSDLRLGTLYCTHSPCVECAKVIITAGIRRVVFETKYATSEEALAHFELTEKLFKMGHVVLEHLHEPDA